MEIRRVVDCIENQEIMPDTAGQDSELILAHLHIKEQDTPNLPLLLPPPRAPPGTLPLFAGKEPAFSEINQHGRH